MAPPAGPMCHANTTQTTRGDGVRPRFSSGVSSMGVMSLLSSRAPTDGGAYYGVRDLEGLEGGEKEGKLDELRRNMMMGSDFSWRVVQRGRRWMGRQQAKVTGQIGLSVEELKKSHSPEEDAFGLTHFSHSKKYSNVFQRKSYQLAQEEEQTQQEAEPQTLAVLVDAGFTIDEISQAIYEKSCDVARGERGMQDFNFFPHVHLNRLGGLHHLESLWYDTRHLWALVYIFQCIFNIAFLLSLNRSIFSVVWSEFVRGAQKVVQGGMEVASHKDLRDAIEVLAEHHIQLHLNETEQDVAHRMDYLRSSADHDTVTRFMVIASFVAFLEVAGVFYLVLRVLMLLYRFATNGGVSSKSEFRAYMAMDRLVRKVIPLMGTFSALKFGVRVHPLVFYNEFVTSVASTTCCGHPIGRTRSGVVFLTVLFVMSRLAYLAIGLAAFGVKVAVIGAKLTHPKMCSWWTAWAEAFALLNNCINAVPLAEQLQDRIFLFIFGGTDSDYQEDELALMAVYRCWLVKSIWEEYRVKQGNPLRTMSLLVTLDHYDLQTLLWEEGESIIETYQVSPEAVKEVTKDSQEDVVLAAGGLAGEEPDAEGSRSAAPPDGGPRAPAA